MTWADVLAMSVSAFAGLMVGVFIARPKLPVPPYYPPMDTRPPTFTEIVAPPVGDPPVDQP